MDELGWWLLLLVVPPGSMAVWSGQLNAILLVMLWGWGAAQAFVLWPEKGPSGLQLLLELLLERSETGRHPVKHGGTKP